MFKDKRGLAMTASSQTAVDAFDACVDEFLASGRDAALLLEKAAVIDPEMPMGQCLRGYFLKLPARAHLAAEAMGALAKAERLAAKGAKREKMHVEALAAWCSGAIRRSNAIWEDILVEYPHDILAFRLAHMMHFFLGDLEQMRDSTARVMPRWSEDVPGYGFVLGCRGFSLEENGDYAQAEPMGRRAVEINEDDIWSGHCVAHVLEMQGRRQDGIAWIDEHEEAWRKRGVFAQHMWWHRALHYLELERFDDVLAAFDREFWIQPTEDNIAIGNAVSMLMRLTMLGIDVGDRWSSAADISAGRISPLQQRMRPFNDLHFIMALAMAGRRDEAETMLASMRAFCETYEDDPVSVVQVYENVGIAVAEAIIAYAARDYARVIEIMSGARYRMAPLGGRWAQRDVWVRMLLHAALADGRDSLARALLAERTASNPTSGPSWKLYADTLARCGAATEADAARARAAALLAA